MRRSANMVPKKPRVVFLGTPVRDGVPPHYVSALFGSLLASQGKYHFEFGLNAMGSVALSRDILARLTLDMKECEGVLMIDADMKWKPEHVFQILDHNKPIVGGVYARKQVDSRWVMTGLPGEEVDEKTGLLKVKEIGTGFLWIAREVLEKMVKEMPEIEFDAADERDVVRPMWNFFFQGVRNRRLLGEDYGFCDSARRLGYDILADTRCVIPHTGNADYPLPHDRKLSDYAIATA